MKKSFFFFAIFFMAQLAFSQVTFVENKGQWADFILYRQQLHQGEFIMAKDRFLYALQEDKPNPFAHHNHHEEELNAEDYEYKGHLYQARFVQANPKVEVTSSDASATLFNYYLGNEPKKWATGVRAYQKVRYHNLYEGIDMEVYGSQHLKYDFTVAPHVSPALIQIAYEGADKVEIAGNGNLLIHTSVTTVTELAPVAYQIIEGKKQEVACSFSLLDYTVSFKFPHSYNENYPLIIDPAIVFSTYTGSTLDNWGFTATGEKGKAIGGGIVFNGGFSGGATGFPTLGAYQTIFQGGTSDVTLTRYTADGSSLIFSTYIGGNEAEQPHSIAIAPNKDILVMGRTNSPNFPMFGSGYDNLYNGGYDLFVVRMDSVGAVLNSTFIGGAGDDAVNITPDDFTFNSLRYNYEDGSRGRIYTDNQGNCYIGSSSRSNNFPTTAAALQSTLKGTQDGVIVKLAANLGSLLYSSYLGGSGDDAVYDIKLDSLNNIYVTGGTSSSNFPTTPGTLQPTLAGTVDGFISKINDTGSAMIASTYFGTSSYDQTFFLETDELLNVYVFGQTRGNMPMVNANYGQVNGKLFITCLNNALTSRVFQTTLGAGAGVLPNLSPSCFQIDKCENLYLSGWSGNFTNVENLEACTGMETSPTAYDATTDGNDFYFAVIQAGASSLLYATFFGGDGLMEHVDGGTSTIDKDGILYQAVCAGCGGSSNFPTTPGVWSQTNNSNNCNLGVVAFNLNTNCNPTSLGTQLSSPLLSAIQAYPNPATNRLTLTHLPLHATVELYDIVGKKHLAFSASEAVHSFELPQTLTGMIFLNISLGKERISLKVQVAD
ncbi:MAG: SBBP repeat-containing protein [Bacteroidia bacterium]